MTPTPSRPTPRISINKLGEYTIATPNRRRTIVRDQKYPRDFIKLRYDRARNILIDFYLANNQDASLVLQAMENLSSAAPKTDWDNQDRQLCIEALEKFLDGADDFEFDGLTRVRGLTDPPKLSIRSVDISVRPELVLRGAYRGQQVVGAVKFHFSKSGPLEDDAAKNVATVLHQYVEQHVIQPGEVASYRHCVILDVFSGGWHRAPTAFRARRQTVDAACHEIALWWAGI